MGVAISLAMVAIVPVLWWRVNRRPPEMDGPATIYQQTESLYDNAPRYTGIAEWSYWFGCLLAEWETVRTAWHEGRQKRRAVPTIDVLSGSDYVKEIRSLQDQFNALLPTVFTFGTDAGTGTLNGNQPEILPEPALEPLSVALEVDIANALQKGLSPTELARLMGGRKSVTLAAIKAVAVKTPPAPGEKDVHAVH